MRSPAPRPPRLPALLGLLLVASCARHPAPAAAPPSPSATPAPAAGAPARFAVVHVDHLQAGALRPFTEARRRWVALLTQHGTTDGRGLYVQTGDSGFLSLRPLRGFAELDRAPSLYEAALAGVDPAEQKRYDAASDALLVPPHRSEIWRFDEALSYGTTDGLGALAGAAWGAMSVEEVDPTPAGDDYGTAWAEVRAALEAEHYPLVRVAYWSRFGTGDLVTFWLAKSQREFLETKPVGDVVAGALGAERAIALFARMRKAVLASDSITVAPKPELSTRAL